MRLWAIPTGDGYSSDEERERSFLTWERRFFAWSRLSFEACVGRDLRRIFGGIEASRIS